MSGYGGDLARFLVPDASQLEDADSSRLMHNKSMDMSMHFAYCSPESLAECTSYIVKSLRGIGLNAPDDFSTSSVSSAVKTVNCLYSLLQLQQESATHREVVEHDAHKLRLEIERTENALRRERERTEALEREIAACLSRETQLADRVKKIAVQASTEKEEFAKSKAALLSKATQYQHELKRKEKEYTKLQEHLSNAVRARGTGTGAGATKVTSIDISAPLTRGATGKASQRQTWKPANSQDEQMFAAISNNYETRQNALLAENSQLRQCLATMDGELSSVVAIVTASVGLLGDEPSADASGDSGHAGDGEESADHVPHPPSMAEMIAAASAPSPASRFEMPFDSVRECIEADMRARMNVLRAHYEASQQRLAEKRDSAVTFESGQHNGDDSRAAAIGGEQPVLSGWEAMGAGGGASEMRLRELEDELDACRRVMEEQERLLRDNLDGFHASETPRRNRHAPERAYLDDSRLFVEADKLERERAMFEKAKATFEKQRKEVTDAAIQLGRERVLLQRQKDAMEEERGVFLRMQQRFLSIQPKTSPSRASPVRLSANMHDPTVGKQRSLSLSSPIPSPVRVGVVAPESPSDHSGVESPFVEEAIESPAFRSSTPAFSPAPNRVARPLAYANAINAVSFSEAVAVSTASKARTGNGPSRYVKFDLGGESIVHPGEDSLPSPIVRESRRLSFGDNEHK